MHMKGQIISNSPCTGLNCPRSRQRQYHHSKPWQQGRVHASARQPKDPGQYANMDELREALQEEGGNSPGFFAGTINWLSSTAFGDTSSSGNGKPRGGMLGRAYRALLDSPLASTMRSGLQLRPGYQATPADRQAADQAEARTGETGQPVISAGQAQRLATVMLCSQETVLTMATRWPALAEADVSQLLTRLMSLKEILPMCNVMRMVELQPRLFLEQPQSAVEAQVAEADRMLREGLAGADIDFMLTEDPTLLFESLESLASGIEKLHELWDVDEQALRQSDPFELALAVRALSESGPPHMY